MAVIHYYLQTPLIRAVVLDSVFPLPEPEHNGFVAENFTLNVPLFEQVFADCQTDVRCQAAYPNLRDRFDSLAVQLETEPMTLPDGATLDQAGLYRMMYPYNQAINYIPFQPRLIAELARGETETLMFLRSGAVLASQHFFQEMWR